ncbi:L-aspartate oxidase [Brevundimonas sp. AJA228-03]|uniref:L-aspartate oxidase n=1 Tax=Brevundimonas sp. AJA228-03 TaxID=2752515 RepID=UPI001ADED754|nr:L-aspartate oxidase [Brevundimonas sp. AJA228-03]QTN19350.1 L-aspartate oxidase [Brevundimonas sp. AJA228-03]
MSRIVHDGPLIIGGGLAGLSAALAAAPRPVLVISPAPLLEAASSAWAQGGVAAALSRDDAPALHLKDTEAAGAGLVDHHAAEVLTDEGRSTVEWLASLGAPFDRDAAGEFSVSLEAAHSKARVARVGGDGAGRAILSALVDSVRAATHITVWEDARLRSLIQDQTGRVRGAVIEHPGGTLVEVLAPAVVLATGGAGGLFGATTTPTALKGEGMALAWAAGAEILDPEFVQFHPTAIDVGLDPMPLATEALRGEGARLIDGEGRFLLGEAPDADLKARDIVARAVHAARTAGRGALLDATRAIGAHFPTEFPAVFAACMKAGLDPRTTPIPVAAAAHYHMGGIGADPDGRTSLPGLFAVGECAATGVHGANRLASNSLLEAAAFGRRTGRLAATMMAGTGPVVVGVVIDDLPAEAMLELRAGMSANCGVVRNGDGLRRQIALIDRLEATCGAAPALVAARLIVEAALARHESRGGHYRIDYPDTASVARHTRLCRAEIEAMAAE